MKVAMFSALNTGYLYPQETSLVLISIRGWVDTGTTVQPEGYRTRDVPACRALRQRAVSLVTPLQRWTVGN